MAKSTGSRRLSPGKPLVREYMIAEAFTGEKTPDITICKYITMRKDGDSWHEYVKSEWVDNPDHFDLRGSKIRITTEIV